MHAFKWHVPGMVDSRVSVEKNKLSDLISGGSTVLLCARLFADSASLVPHVAAHMKCWQITYDNLVRRPKRKGRVCTIKDAQQVLVVPDPS